MAPRAPSPVLSVAPMMQHTNRHFRRFMRAITRRTLLCAEMVTAGAVLGAARRGQLERLLGFDPVEHPLSLQLGGSDPAALAESARIAEDLGYDEIDLNVGCPSDRVQQGRFGVCLMDHPELVAECVARMRAAVRLPVTVKHRIGIAGRASDENLARFVTTVAAAGCDRFTVHARAACLDGLSPKENRRIPPLRYEAVWRLKREHPHLIIQINGGVRSLDHASAHLEHVDGVMIGRAAVDDPWLFHAADARFFGEPGPNVDREAVVLSLFDYIEAQLALGEPLPRLVKPLLNLFAGRAGARAWKRHLSTRVYDSGAGVEVIREALALCTEVAERVGG